MPYSQSTVPGQATVHRLAFSQALDEVIKLGVPEEAARDFLYGHLNIQMAVLFDQIPGAVFSDAANKALQRGLKEFIKDDWRKVFEPDNVKDQIASIT